MKCEFFTLICIYTYCITQVELGVSILDLNSLNFNGFDFEFCEASAKKTFWHIFVIWLSIYLQSYNKALQNTNVIYTTNEEIFPKKKILLSMFKSPIANYCTANGLISYFLLILQIILQLFPGIPIFFFFIFYERLDESIYSLVEIEFAE